MSKKIMIFGLVLGAMILTSCSSSQPLTMEEKKELKEFKLAFD